MNRLSRVLSVFLAAALLVGTLPYISEKTCCLRPACSCCASASKSVSSRSSKCNKKCCLKAAHRPNLIGQSSRQASRPALYNFVRAAGISQTGVLNVASSFRAQSTSSPPPSCLSPPLA